MQVLLIHPPSPFLLDSHTFPPLGLLYLARALRTGGHTPVVLDMGCGDALEGYNPGCIGITATTSQLTYLKPLVETLRKLYPATPILFGGPHFSCEPSDATKWNVEGVGVGECEDVICEAVENVRFSQWCGLYYGPGYKSNINGVGTPDRTAVDIHRYRYTLNGVPTTTIITQRGCQYRCDFCSRWEGTRDVRRRRINDVMGEIEEIKALGFGGLMFYDDEINLFNAPAYELAEALRGQHMTWRAFIRTNLFTENLARVFKDAGCYELCAGVESGSDFILRKMHKGTTSTLNTRARAICRDYGIRFKAFLMLGLPFEDHETVALTRQWLLDNKPDDFDICLFQPYPGTQIVREPHRYDIEFDLNYLRNPIFHKGTPGEYVSSVRTKALSSEQLLAYRESIEVEVREALGLAKLGGKV